MKFILPFLCVCVLQAQEERGALDKLNEYRKAAGLNEVELDDELSSACVAHCKYLVKNNSDGTRETPHDEVKGRDGFTEAGQRAARNSVISWAGTAQKAVDEWMATVFHRIPLLRYGVEKIGVGVSADIVALDCQQGGKLHGHHSKDPILWPPDGATDVPVSFCPSGEVPDPLPVQWSPPCPAGFPVTIQFPLGKKFTSSTMTLLDSNDDIVECYLTTPESPLAKHQICAEFAGLIPKKKLKRGASYTVRFACKVNDEEFTRAWTFRTID